MTSNGSSLSLTPTATFEVIAQESGKTVAQIAQEFNTFQQVISTYDTYKAIAPNTRLLGASVATSRNHNRHSMLTEVRSCLR